MIKGSATFDQNDNYYSVCLTRVMFYLVSSPIFGGFIIFIIVLNTIALAME